MEIIQTGRSLVPATQPLLFPRKSQSSFMESNTREIGQKELQRGCIIPVFAKDNETTISHTQFIEAAFSASEQFYAGEDILEPAIRVSHAIKGRVPDAMGKPANLLLDDEKTIYYERMAFIIEIPSIHDTVDGNHLSLCVGGVRAYNHENLYSKKSAEKFKVFVGFQNKVCCNLCIWTNGIKVEIKARTLHELAMEIFNLLTGYEAIKQIRWMQELTGYSLTESQFAKLIGRLRMYPFLGTDKKQSLPMLDLGDSQLNVVVRDYYQDKSFCRMEDGSINLWRLYNLLTGANKSSYIDRFLDRNINVSAFTEGLKTALNESTQSWYLT